MDLLKELKHITEVQREQLSNVQEARKNYTNIDGSINTQQAMVSSLHELNVQQNVTNLLLHLITRQNEIIIKQGEKHDR